MPKGDIEGSLEVGEIQEYTFEEFQKRLGELRKVSEMILGKTMKPDNLPSTKEGNYKDCVKNFKERNDLLDKFAANLKEKESQFTEFIREYNKDEDKQLEVMQAKRDQKSNNLFLGTIEAERKREDFYRKRAVEKYMENYLEIKEGNGTHNG